jgi:hypothetical protein
MRKLSVLKTAAMMLNSILVAAVALSFIASMIVTGELKAIASLVFLIAIGFLAVVAAIHQQKASPP